VEQSWNGARKKEKIPISVSPSRTEVGRLRVFAAILFVLAVTRFQTYACTAQERTKLL
jgi:hypothetical protein